MGASVQALSRSSYAELSGSANCSGSPRPQSRCSARELLEVGRDSSQQPIGFSVVSTKVPSTRHELLGVILMNPPTGTGHATRRHLHVATEVLECNDFKIANLLATPTRSVVEITDAGKNPSAWGAARPALRALIRDADELLIGWGLGGGFSGAARHYFLEQVDWVWSEIARARPTPRVWTVGPEPRHPSRWHQYVSDKHGRAQGGDFPTRLRSVLTESSGVI